MSKESGKKRGEEAFFFSLFSKLQLWLNNGLHFGKRHRQTACSTNERKGREKRVYPNDRAIELPTAPSSSSVACPYAYWHTHTRPALLLLFFLQRFACALHLPPFPSSASPLSTFSPEGGRGGRLWASRESDINSCRNGHRRRQVERKNEEERGYCKFCMPADIL